MNTPDTEWREKVRDWWYSVQDLLNEEVNVSLPEHKRVEIEQIIKEVIFSRDTYWKERVRKEWQKGYDEGVVSAQSRVLENTFILTDSCMWEANKQNGTRSEHCIEVVDEKTGQVRYIATGSRVKFIEGNITEVHTQEKYNEEQVELDTLLDNLK